MMLEFENVTGTKGKFKLDNISFALPEGYIMGLAGANGAGKTTLIDYIMNDKIRYSGTIKIAGYDIRENHGYMKQFIGLANLLSLPAKTPSLKSTCKNSRRSFIIDSH